MPSSEDGLYNERRVQATHSRLTKYAEDARKLAYLAYSII